MKSHPSEAAREKMILLAMLTDDSVCRAVSAQYSSELFASQWANLVSGWAKQFWDKYQKAPSRAVLPIFNNWAEANEDDAQVELLSKFLAKLRDGGEPLNSQYVIDLAAGYFTEVRLKKLAESIQGALDVGQVDRAELALSAYRKIELGSDEAIDVFEDQAAIAMAFESKADSLFQMPGDFGLFVNPLLERDGFIALMGAAKRGKSHWLNAFAFGALRCRRRVAIFQCGDLSRGQAMMRIATRVARRPRRAGKFAVPTGFEKTSDGAWGVVQDIKIFEEQLQPQDVQRAFAQFKENVLRDDDPYLKLSCHATKTLSPQKLDAILDSWQNRGWVPDVIVIDYADIMAANGKWGEPRDAVNSIWERLRGISQERKCLLITATQTNTDSYSAEVLHRNHFANDRRKFDHVTGMLGINQTPSEKLQGIYRMNIVLARDEDFDENRCCHCAGNLAFCNPVMRSKLFS